VQLAHGSVLRWLLERTAVGAIALGLTLAVFLVLPVLKTIGNPLDDDLIVRDVGTGELPPPPPPPPEEPPPEEPEQEPEPPRLAEEAPPLDLAQLELALNPSFGDGVAGDFTIALVNQLSSGEGGEELDRIFSSAELDQTPRPLFQRQPSYPPELRRAKREGTVHVLFTVDENGRVQNAKVDRATDPAFEDAALEAVRQWRFEPGTRNGEKVRFRMKVPITFDAT
jgi:protein TonB